MMNHFVIKGLSVAMVLAGATIAQAQEAEPAADGAAPAAAAEAPAPAPAPAAAPAPAVTDGPRFRFGVSGGGGFFTFKSDVDSSKASCVYFGTDLRLGAQINDLIGVYAQPTLGYYVTGSTVLVGAGGLAGIAVVADATFLDRFFVGLGIGYTVYNSPAGVTPILRFGGYPVMSRHEGKARRKGLMLGLDLRFTPLDGLKTVVMPTFNVGYEAF